MFNNVDADGGSMAGSGSPGALYRVDPRGGAIGKLRDIEISNTLCWSPDGSLFYFADTMKNEIRAYEYDSTRGDITGKSHRFFAGFERGLPDGSAIDRDGYLWNCRYGGHGIARITPDGQLDRFIELPTANPTTCTFGGPNLSTLFITLAGYDTVPGDRLAMVHRNGYVRPAGKQSPTMTLPGGFGHRICGPRPWLHVPFFLGGADN